MFKFNERAANTVQNPENPDKVLFLNPDGVLQLKDSAGTLTNLVAENATGQSTARPFKVYKALLTQTGTNAPVATVLENTLGGTVVWTRAAPGNYRGTLSGAFIENKTFILIQGSNDGDTSSATIYDRAYRDSLDEVVVVTVSLDPITAGDSLMNGTYLLIEVYP